MKGNKFNLFIVCLFNHQTLLYKQIQIFIYNLDLLIG